MATVSQIVHLNDSKLEWLASHMDLDIRVHREFYRLQESTLELAKVSKIVLAIDSGNAESFSGKILNEISLDGKYIFFSKLLQ